jgi:hypothetical protein
MLISQKRSFSLSGRRAKSKPIASNFLSQTIDGQVALVKIQKFCTKAGKK